MTLAQLGQAVRDSGVHIDLLDFDACLMGMYEVAYEFIGLVDYMVFSEEVEPGNGNPYTRILNGLVVNPGMSAMDLSSVIVNEFVDSYRGSRNSVTKSAVDMGQIQELHNRILDLARTMRVSLSVYGPAIANARARAQHYVEKGNIDLISFLNNLSGIGGDISSKADELSSFVPNSVVIANAHYSSTYTEGGVVTSGSVDNSHGLAIFLPAVEELREGELEVYGFISCNSAEESWAAFVTDFLDATGGGTGSQGSIAMVPGGFAYAIAWFDDYGDFGYADVDIYMVEPDGTVGSPWIGESTPNGYFSPDSYYSGESYEIYGAKDMVMRGEYMLIVNYYDDYYDGWWYEDYANVCLLYMDPVNGINFWEVIPDEFTGEYIRRMSLFNPAPEVWTDDVIYGILWGWYSDWWFPASTARSLRAMSFEKQKEILLRVKAYSESRRGKHVHENLLRLYHYYRQQRGAK